jgi:WD40 repeat protein
MSECERSKFLAAFSNTGRYFAQVSAGGKLRIWDVNSCTLKEEYTPDVHLISPFTDLHWITTAKKVRRGYMYVRQKPEVNLPHVSPVRVLHRSKLAPEAGNGNQETNRSNQKTNICCSALDRPIFSCSAFRLVAS